MPERIVFVYLNGLFFKLIIYEKNIHHSHVKSL